MKQYKQTKRYDFALAANATATLDVDGSFYKIMAANGAVSVRRNGASELPLDVGQGERDIEFTRLEIKNLTAGTVSGFILVGDSNFIDDSVLISAGVAINGKQPSIFFKSTALLGANGSVEVVTAAQNVNGIEILNANLFSYSGVSGNSATLLAKVGAPTSITDGDVLFGAFTPTGANPSMPPALSNPVRVAAGKSLWVCSQVAETTSLKVVNVVLL